MLAKYKLSLKHRTRFVKDMPLPKGVQISSIFSIFDDNLIINSVVSRSMLILDTNLFPLFTFDFSHLSYHEADINFNKDRTAALVTFTNFFDKSGKSYYGLNYLCLIDFRKMSVKMIETVTGPIHHCTWAPSAEEFLVISGSLPAHSIVYNKYGEAKMVLGTLYRNFGEWCPDSSKIALAGFGNIDTKIDVRDCSSLALLGSAKTNHATHFKWCADGRQYLVAITHDKLKVDNGFKIVSCAGAVRASVDMKDKHLHQVMFSNRNVYRASVGEKGQPGAEVDEKAKPAVAKKVMNLVKNDCIKSIMKVEDDSIRFVTDADVRSISKSIEAELQRNAVQQKAKDDEARAKKDDKAKPQIVLRKGANFKKDAEISKQNEEAIASGDQIDGKNTGAKSDVKNGPDKNTTDLLEILRAMNAS